MRSRFRTPIAFSALAAVVSLGACSDGEDVTGRDEGPVGNGALAANRGLQPPSPLRLDAVRSLFSRGPAEEHRNELMLFGQLVGSWDFEFVSSVPGEEGNFDGEWHFAWILEGRGVQDVWIVPKPRRGHLPAEQYEYASTVRIYDPSIDAWRVSWHGPIRENFQTFIGRQVGDEIIMAGGETRGGLPMRWIMSSIQPASFDWRAEVSIDNGATWIVVQTLHAVRTRT